MVANLNGYENTPKEERPILTEEELNNYISITQNSYSESIILYAMAELIRKDNFDYEQYYEQFNINSKEQFFELLSQEMGMDILETNSEDLLEEVPKEMTPEIKRIIDSITDNVQDLEQLAESFTEQINIEELDDLYNRKLMEIATEVSKYNLSQISPELYARVRFLKYINFQNTGAKLDFNYIKENSNMGRETRICSENLRGTELISFDSELYRDENEYSSYQLKPENFDISQYQTIIESFNRPNIKIEPEIADFLIDQKLQENNQWLLDFSFENLDKNLLLAKAIWEKMTPEVQLKNQEKFKKFAQFCKEKDQTIFLIRLFSSTHPEILENMLDDILSLYRGQNGNLNSEFYDEAFPYMSDDYKEGYYEQHKNDSIESRIRILKHTNDEYVNSKFIELFDKYAEEKKQKFNGIHDNIFEIGNIFYDFTSHEFDDSVIKHVLDFTERYVQQDKANYEPTLDKIFGNLNPKNQVNYYKDFIQLGLRNNISPEVVEKFFDKMPFGIRKEHFSEMLEYAQSVSTQIAHYIRGDGYINMLYDMGRYSPDEQQKFIEQNAEEILLSLRTKYENSEFVYQDSLSQEDRKKFDKDYPAEYIQVLLDMDARGDLNYENVNVIIDNIPRLGKDIINRLYKSNSDMIRANASQLISAVASLPKEDAILTIEDTERIFSKSTIPDFFKIYKFYENVVERRKHLLSSALKGNGQYSPELQQAETEREGKKIIFSDLLNISLKSNNKSLKNFLDVLENGNETYIKFLKNDRNLDTLTKEEKETLKKYADTLYAIYDETDASRIDKRVSGQKIISTKDYIKTIDDMAKRYVGDAFPTKLSDTMIDFVVGRMDELVGGKRTIEDFKKYMEECNQKSNERHAQLEKVKLELEPGDLIKGVKNATEYLQSLFSSGIRAGEFLGTSEHTDATPLDSDHSLILPSTAGTTLSDTISHTTSSSYGSFFLVIKKDKNKIQYTRDNPEYTFNDEESPKYESRLGSNIKKQPESIQREAIKTRISNRINGTYNEPKLEAFSSRGKYNDHYGIRTGMSITDVDYIVVERYDKRIGYELAMNGTFIPVVDRQTGEVIFGMDDYKMIREQMQGLSFFGAQKFEVDQSAYTDKVEEKVRELFPDGSTESIGQADATIKRDAIERQVRQVVLDELSLGFETEMTGDMTPRIYRIY